ALVYSDSKAEEAIEKALELIKNDEELHKMSRRAKNLKKSNAAERIVECLDIWRS
ncbi:MAG: UDP-N-acetylglucosamine--N-acetylmuramyl-(pentapeptide) pyrophosphoryl-undecaprenol N-acetylglucosamine transferase, partial [Cetobacterium sp.]